MVLIGYLAFLDPPKDSAAKAISRLAKDGVCVKILTGDNGGVAAAVCRKVGVNADGMLLGSELDALSDEELARRADSTQLFAKLSPLQKARVVRVLRSGAGRDGAGSGHEVSLSEDAVTGAFGHLLKDCAAVSMPCPAAPPISTLYMPWCSSRRRSALSKGLRLSWPGGPIRSSPTSSCRQGR